MAAALELRRDLILGGRVERRVDEPGPKEVAVPSPSDCISFLTNTYNAAWGINGIKLNIMADNSTQ